jgi:hypothetical protein
MEETAMRIFSGILTTTLLTACVFAAPAFAQATAPVPTTKILAISHSIGAPMTPAERAQIMPHEVHDTVNAYLAGKIDQWYFQTDGKGVVFIVNASTPEEAKAILEKFPLGHAGKMGFDYIPLGPLNPLRIINDMVR